MEKQKRVKYTPEFKIMVVKAVKQRHLSYEGAAREFGINPNDPHNGRKTVRLWVSIFDEFGEVGLSCRRASSKAAVKQNAVPTKPISPEQSKRLSQLEEENELLRAEIAYLKKLKALLSK